MYFLTELKEGLAISFAAIRANKLRSVLTLLGVIIGEERQGAIILRIEL